METQATSRLKADGKPTPTLLEAKDITPKHRRLEREVIPLGATRVEVELAEVELDELKLDPTNPRLKFKLEAQDIKKATQDQLMNLLWEDSEVKALRRSIEAYGGIIEAIIVA